MRKFPVSVSGVWSRYFDHFDPHAVIAKNFSRWSADPASKYFGFFESHRVAGVSDIDAQNLLAQMWAANGQAASAAGTRPFYKACPTQYHLCGRSDSLGFIC